MAGWGSDLVGCGVTVELESVDTDGNVEGSQTLVCALPQGHAQDHIDPRFDVEWPNDVDLVIV